MGHGPINMIRAIVDPDGSSDVTTKRDLIGSSTLPAISSSNQIRFIGRRVDISDDRRTTAAADVRQFTPNCFLRAVLEPGQLHASLPDREALPETTVVIVLEDRVE